MRHAARVWLSAMVVLALLLMAFASPAAAQRAQSAPEEATGWTDKALATARRHMVAAANPIAAEAGREILRAGGSAVDAAIATVLVLGLVEPQSSGLGGGAFLLVHDAKSGRTTSYDGRETAPAAAGPDRFLRDGKPMGFRAAVNSGLSVGVPGLVRGLELAHKAHGRLTWSRLFEPAIRIAKDGFAVSPRLNGLLGWYGAARFSVAARAHYFDGDGRPRAVGHVLKSPELAATLERVAKGGSDAFYSGPVAEAIVAAVNEASPAGGMTTGDVARYRALERPPVCIAYRGRRVCGMGPPSSGGLTVAQVLRMIEPLEGVHGPASRMSARAVHAIVEAEKLAYADRDFYLADPAFCEIPAGYLEASYLAGRRALIDPARAMEKPLPGTPPGAHADRTGVDATRERGGTTHLSVIDGEGNAVALTATIEGAFGSGLWAAGFLLNNELTDFSFKAVDDRGRAVANRVEGGKRPRSSMAPTIVFGPDGKAEIVLGAPGGHRIILYVVKALVGMVDWDLDPQAAAALVNFGDRGRGLEIEPGARVAGLAMRLGALGHRLRAERMVSGLHIVARRNGRLEGGADPRREGAALGD